ncbi:hypothetical protein N7460_000291 [Penicillium canescens]|uniref:Uncharacterized protein n=1 Tax=Penicillium canescens TaxID=5083 RepID=A0AAD6IN65_PENCN|nr:hypothetical protein N7460_000243 [Penicillium canescens]KAJ6057017.1 hypothetical protein N7460_000291 [Penicillium canescens]
MTGDLEIPAKFELRDRYNRTDLWHAVSECNVAEVKLLLKSGRDALAADRDRVTPLNCAIMRNNILITRLLLKHLRAVYSMTTFLDDKDVNGAELPLCLAAEFERTQMIDLLLEFGADVNAANQQRQNYSVAKRIVEKRELNPNILGCFRWTPLGHAARDGNVDMVELLLRRDDIRINAVDPGEDSPLWLATKCGRTKVVGLLLQQGNRVNINCRNNKESETALSAAAGSGDLHTVKLILRDARTDLNAVDKSGKTAIWHADSKGHLQVVKELLKDPRLSCDPESIASVAVNH